MRVYGLDFTSAPGRKKPLTLAECRLEDAVLKFESFQSLTTFQVFEDFLWRDGAWVCGMDFPFGQPRELVEALEWPPEWTEYVAEVARCNKEDFENRVAEYMAGRPEGDKLLYRCTDRAAKAQSPMRFHGTPVGKMFYQGAPRLLRSDLSIQPCRPRSESRTVIEAYPALVARRFIGRQKSYKNDKQDTPQRKAARKEIVSGIRSSKLRNHYGFTVELDGGLAHRFVEDRTGDLLDAALCAIQAAWAYIKRDENYGVPPECDPDEGWILDPALLADGR